MPKSVDPVKEWAVLVYMCADVPQVAMHKAARTNLLQMAEVGSSGDVWIAAQFACPGPWTYRYIFPERPPGSASAVIDPVQRIPSVDSGVPSTIKDFFSWATAACPAKNTMLILWGHGFGIDYYTPWKLANLDLFSQISPAHGDAVQSNEPVALESHPGASVVNEVHDPYRFGPDYKFKTILDNTQIGDVLRACAKSLPAEQKLAVLGFDSCVMAMAEVWSEMRDTAALGVASQAALPFSSWPYDGFLERLLQQPAAQPAEVGKMLMEAFLEFYGTKQAEYVTISVCDLKLIPIFENAIAPLAQQLAAASVDPRARQNIFEARRYCPEYDQQGFIDLGCFCRYLKITMPGSSVSAACDSAIRGLEAFVTGSGYSPPKPNKTIALSSGVSVWLPPWIQDPNAFAIEKNLAESYLIDGYPKIQFAVTTGWGKFLANFRDHAWARTPKGESLTGFRASRSAAKFRERDGRNTMRGDMGDHGNMGDHDMGDHDMGDHDMGDHDMGDHDMGAAGKKAQKAFSTVSRGAAGVVLRATVESFGPAGDAELHLTVKWPASSLGANEMGSAQPRDTSHPDKTNEADPKSTGGRLNARAKRPLGPVGGSSVVHSSETPPTE